MTSIDIALRAALVCAVGYLIIQVLIVCLIVYKNNQDKQARKSLDRFKMEMKRDTKWRNR